MLPSEAFEAWVVFKVTLTVTLNNGDVKVDSGDEKDPEEGLRKRLKKSDC